MSIVKIRTSKGENVSIEVDLKTIRVGELKSKIEEQLNVPAAEQRLIFGGHVLKDDKLLTEYGVQADHVIHMVRAASKSTTSPPSPAPAPTTTTSSPSGAPPAVNPAGMNDFLQQMMQSPMMDPLFNNPEMFQQIMMSNPRFQEIIQRNPEMASVFRNPAVMRQAMQAMRNPRLMQELMRHADTAMQNIEMMPGGAAHLARFYNEVQEPLLEGAVEQARMATSAATATTSETQTQSQPTQPGAGPLRNPWASNPTGAANPLAALFGQPSSDTTPANPFASLLGNAGANPMGDLGAAMQMMNNPFVQSILRQMVSDPELFRQMMNNPLTQQMASQNPMLAGFIQNPEAMRQMMQMFLSMQSAAPASTPSTPAGQPDFASLLQSLGSPSAGTASAPAPASAPASAQPPSQASNTSTTTPAGAPTTPLSPPFDFSSVMASLGVPPPTSGSGTGTVPDFGQFLASMLGTQPAPPAAPATVPAPSAPAMSQAQLRDRYARELEQLHEMGFIDDAANVRALQLTNGSVQLSIERLLDGR